MSKIRKALIAAATAAVGVLVTYVQATGLPKTGGEWAGVFSGALGAALIAGYATWQIPNAPA